MVERRSDREKVWPSYCNKQCKFGGGSSRHRYWLCKCDCGNEKVVEESHLKNGHTKSCGCYRREKSSSKKVDLTGSKFGRLKVIGKADVQNRSGEYLRCVCSCGRTIEVLKDSLLTGKTKSCGCLQAETRKKNMKKAIHFVDGTCIERITNQKNTANNTSGYRGVYKRENSRWRAAIGFKGKVYNLGTFLNLEDAVAARKKAEKELYEPFLQKHGIKYSTKKETIGTVGGADAKMDT